ncbi:putative U-box domain-containing protein 50 [Forsythia ovata]|uniref:RING-type E3 ubiquitin transferase n=1 Tax=Forsythia ovata TaxID=205694 RepID=A0ABD1SKC0_9LAMI
MSQAESTNIHMEASHPNSVLSETAHSAVHLSDARENGVVLLEEKFLGQETPLTIDQIDLLREQQKILSGEVALHTIALKRLSEEAAQILGKSISNGAERIEVLKLKIQRAEDAIQLNRKEANVNKERRAKAEWAISLCNTRAMELEICINEEVLKNADLKKQIDSRKFELFDLQGEVEEKRSKLNSILELQRELSNKLQLSSSAKSRAEVQLEKAVQTRTNMVREIEELRGQRDVIQRRIEFCREKEFTAAEIRAATEDFSEGLRLKSRGQLTNVYKGRINHMTVAIKMYNSANAPSHEAFTAKVLLE